MAKTKEELKEMFSTGKKPTGDDFAELIDGVEGEKGATGSAGKDGANGQRGSRIYTSDKITGTSTDGTVFEDSGISGALIYDYALNKSTGNLYVCSKAGDADVAEWKYDSNIKGPAGAKGADGKDGADGKQGPAGKDGADGKNAEPQFTAEEVTALKALIETDEE